jgi:hypothetical protein
MPSQNLGAGGVAQEVEHQPSKHEALSSNPILPIIIIVIIILYR